MLYMKTLKVYKVKVSQFEKQQLLCDGCGSNEVAQQMLFM